jgi:hypothetical protein
MQIIHAIFEGSVIREGDGKISTTARGDNSWNAAGEGNAEYG